ncbi:phosphoribosylformylglycinamidine cyclo-ligase [Gorillibacterium timonense]|uniref:phosphoribosylformylglycinamidine cyclo-ligase n=1 Tax=Gorillibacterium timonense TaxID=1689269 RepID=UPI00071E1484|nr:phosphoribosylformylglycinamidine cyclo-ligase [Gorillibacterium timonense]
MSDAYKKAGVDIAAGNAAVERMKKHVKRSLRPEVLAGLGGFGALFGLNKDKYEEPVLVSGTDGVGTKLMLAFAMDKHDTIGIDAVAMCVNDIVVQGAEPLFFLDYLACGKVVPEKIEAIVAGIAEGCVRSGCSLIGGETAEMPGMYGSDDYDIAGFAVGIVDRKKIVDGSAIKPGDVLIGLASSGVHSNGFSLVRRLLLEEAGLALDQPLSAVAGLEELAASAKEAGQPERTLGDALLEPTRLYVKPILSILEQVAIKGMAHITGGGFTENIPRMLPEGVGVEIEFGSWPIHPLFALMQAKGSLSYDDLFRTFNMGIGMVLAVAPEDADLVERLARENGEQPFRIGQAVSGEQVVTYKGVTL